MFMIVKAAKKFKYKKIFLQFGKGYKKLWRITRADLMLKAKTDCFSCTSC